jgi:hypothetical protein
MSKDAENPNPGGNHYEPPARCIELVDALWAGSIDEAQLAELESLVVADESARRFYIRAMNVMAHLRREFAADENESLPTIDWAAKLAAADEHTTEDVLDEPAAPTSIAPPLEMPPETDSPPGVGSWDATRWLLALVSVVVIGIATALLMRPDEHTAQPSSSDPKATPSTDPVDAPSTRQSNSPMSEAVDDPEQVATVIGLDRATWPTSARTLRVGGRLQAGQLIHLQAGMMEIAFDSGARVTLLAPAEIELTSANGARLALGRVSTVVPEQAVGFTLETPTGRIVDFGTQFTAEVAADRTVHATVLQGEIEVRVDDKEQNPLHTERLIAGQAVTIDPNGQPQKLAVTEPAPPEHPQSYERWRAYSEKLRLDPSLLVYYTFEDPAGTMNPPPQVQNRATATRGQLNGQLGNGLLPSTSPQWASGRWFHKGALLFRAAQRQIVMTPDWPTVAPRRELTVAAWVRFTRDRSAWNLIATQWARKEPENRMLFHLAVASPPFVHHPDAHAPRLAVHMADDANVEYIVADEANDGGETLAAHDWFFVAFTAVAGGPVRLYKNGLELSSSGQNYPKEEFPQANVPLILGGKNDDQFFLEGVIDEFAAFGRALTSDEIKAFYEAGRP